MDELFHVILGGRQQGGYGDDVCIFGNCRVDELVGGNVSAQVNDFIAIDSQLRCNQTLADVVQVALGAADDDLALEGTVSTLHIRRAGLDQSLHAVAAKHQLGQKCDQIVEVFTQLVQRGNASVGDDGLGLNAVFQCLLGELYDQIFVTVINGCFDFFQNFLHVCCSSCQLL